MKTILFKIILFILKILTKSDRVFLFSINTPYTNKNVYHNQYSFVVCESKNFFLKYLKKDMQNLPTALYAKMLDALYKTGVYDIIDSEKESDSIKNISKELGIKSYYISGIFKNKELIGSISLGYLKKTINKGRYIVLRKIICKLISKIL